MPAPFFVKEVRQLLAIASLRQGEQENCLLNHSRKSCIYPIRIGGQHQLKRGSTGAIREFSALLNEDARDASARCLLNLAHMTLGEHPQKVPPPWLIPTARFDSEYDIKRFTDVAPKLGLNVTGRAGGSVMEDFDKDGLLDLLMSSSGPLDQLRFFRNNGDGTFKERTKEAGLTGVTGGLNLIHGDFNNDGDQDIFEVIGGALAGDAYTSVLFENPGHGGRWLTLELTGARENRSAIGARVRVRVKTKEGTHNIHRAISSGGSFGGSPLRLHVGLGDALSVNEIEIRWPVSGKTQLLRHNLSLDRHYRLREGESQLAVMELKRFSLSAKNGTEPHRHH